MALSVEDIARFFNELATTTSAPDVVKGLEERDIAERAREATFVSRFHVCPISRARLNDTIGGLNADRAKDLVMGSFQDAEVMLSMLCLVDAIIYPASVEGATTNERIRYWINDLHRIGAPSVEGVALEAALDQAKRMFVLKVPAGQNDLIHEWVVASILNLLRGQVSNFAYLYGGFRCSPPLVVDREVATWCTKDGVNGASYLVYENIAPAVSFGDFCRTASPEGWLNQYIQVLYALRAAGKAFSFTHYDLHTNNVLVRRIGERTFALPYTTEVGEEYVITDAIPTIIDFGRSHIKYEGQHYGVFTFIRFGILPRREFLLYDAYRLLGSSLAVLYGAQNWATYNLAALLLAWFHPDESAEFVLQAQSSLGFILPYNDVTATWRFDDFLAYIRNQTTLPFVVRETRGYPVISCAGPNMCAEGRNFFRLVGMEREGANTIFEFYDLGKRLQKEGRTSDFRSLVAAFDYPRAIAEAQKSYNTLARETAELVSNLNIVIVSGLPLRNLADTGLLSIYEESVFRVAKLYDRVFQLTSMREGMLYAAEIYGDEATLGILRQVEQGVANVGPLLNEALALLRTDRAYLDGLRSTRSGEIDAMLRRDPRLIRWWTTPEALLRLA